MSFLLLTTITVTAQETPFWRNLGVKINYSQTQGFSSDFIADTFQWERPNYQTFRLGLSYDLKTQKKMDYNFNLNIDWSKDITETIIEFEDGSNDRIGFRSTVNGYVYLILESQFLYKLSSSGNLKLFAAPQLNVTFINDEGINNLAIRNSEDELLLGFTDTIDNHILRPSLAVGLQYDLSRKSRLGLFYSHSFTPIYFGEFTYENSNGVTASGDWKFNGHQIGVTWQFFPFRK